MSDQQHSEAGEPTAAAFLDLLEKMGLVPAAALATLRRQVAESKTPIPARRIAKLLVDKQVLAPAIAQRLLGGQGPQPKAPAAKAPSAPDRGRPSLLDEELPPLAAGLPPLAGGSLDGLMNDPSLAAAVEEGSPLGPLRPPKKGLFASLAQGLRLDDWYGAPNMLWVWIGSGAAALVLLLVLVIILVVTAQDPEALLAQADADYRKGSFAEAIRGYDDFLGHFPRHAAAGRARVRCGLAELRLKIAEPGGEPAAAETAKRVVPAISAETEFDAEAGPLLAAILPQVAERLAARARSQLTLAAIAEAQELLALGQRYIPAADKPLERLGRIEASLALSRVKAASDRRRSKALAVIAEAVATKDFAVAYGARATLLAAYPDLSRDEELLRAVRSISAAEQAAASWVATTEPAERPAAPGSPSTPILAQRQFTAAAPEAEGHVVLAAAGGAVYALDATEGKVLWRRFVGWNLPGCGPNGPPAALDVRPGGDAVLAVAPHGDARGEIQCVAAATGRLRWRHPLRARCSAAPVVADGRVLVATLNGRLLMLDASSGDAAGYVRLPQPLPLAPAVDARRKLVFQLADHDNLFVLALPDGRCLQVFPLGHEPGAISTPPVVLGDCLLIAVNRPGDESTLVVLKIQSLAPESATPPLSLAATMPLKGHVDAAEPISEGRVLVTTDAGAIHLFQAAPLGASEPLEELADKPAWIDAAQGAMAQAPVAIEHTVFLVRNAAAPPGVVVSAVNAGQGTPYWQTSLAAPPAGEPLLDAPRGKVTLATALGTVFQLDARALGTAAAVESTSPPPSPGLRRPVSAVTRCGGCLVLSGGAGSDQVLAADLAEAGRPLRTWCLPGPLSCPPMAFAGGLLAPSTVGQVYLLDPLSGKSLSEPFQPRLQAAALPAWSAPVAISDREAVISDGRGKLYRLSLVDQPAARLVGAGVECADAIVSPLARVGQMVCGVDAPGKLDFFQLPGLTRAGQQALPGRLAWGPRRVGQRVLLSTDSGQLCCFDAAGRPLWQSPLPYGPLVGSPLALGDHYLLAAGGVVWRVDGRTGKQLGKVNAPGPLATGPVLLRDRLVAGGADGSLYQLIPP